MLKVNELFAGIGAFRKALSNLNIPYEVVGISEIDKFAINSYNAIYGETRNYGDISKVSKLDYADLWTYGFPCQDISVAGKQRGINENTRSGLLYEVERLLHKSVMYGEQPKYLILENVKNLVGKQFKPQFDEWLKRLDELGYNTYWKVLNAKNYGIPQSRERVFAISIRKDIDTGYEFPIGFDNGKRLKDILESEVDEKYYLSNEKVKLFLKQGNVNPSSKGINGNVCTNDINKFGKMKNPYDIANEYFQENDFTEPIALDEQNKCIRKDFTVGTLTTDGSSPKKNNRVVVADIKRDFRIRKLTPLECWRLMGFTDEQFHKAEQVNSNSQLYKQAGNSIVVNVLEAILGNLLVEERSDWLDTTEIDEVKNEKSNTDNNKRSIRICKK